MISKKQINKMLSQESIGLFIEKIHSARIDMCFIGECVERFFLKDKNLKDSTDFSVLIYNEEGDVLDKLQKQGINVFVVLNGNIIASFGNNFFHIQEVNIELTEEGIGSILTNPSLLTREALALKPNGELFSSQKTYKDIKEGRVRFIGDIKEVLTKDPTRLLKFLSKLTHYSKISPTPYEVKVCFEKIELVTGLNKDLLDYENILFLKGPYLSHALYDFALIDEGKFINFLSKLFNIKVSKKPDIKACEKINSLNDSIQHLTQYKINPAVVLYKVFGLTVDAILDRYKFYGEDKKNLEILFDLFEYVCSLPKFVLTNQDDTIKLMQQVIYKYGRNAALNLLMLNVDKSGVNIFTFQETAKQKKPIMPICVKDVIMHTDKNSVQMLSMLETIWLESGCSLGKNDLLNFIKQGKRKLPV